MSTIPLHSLRAGFTSKTMGQEGTPSSTQRASSHAYPAGSASPPCNGDGYASTCLRSWSFCVYACIYQPPSLTERNE
jgi:hypothetical protein